MWELFGAQQKNGTTLPETNSQFAAENKPGPKRKLLFQFHPFSGAKMLVSGRVQFL